MIAESGCLNLVVAWRRSNVLGRDLIIMMITVVALLELCCTVVVGAKEIG